ncbi:MAG: phenylalanine--tRNA ligase subunit beta [Burkholderiales bacterium]
MKLSENWLRTWVNPAFDSVALAHLLTMGGLEVESIETLKPAFRGVVVAQVRDVQLHPDADRLRVCQVDSGDGELLQIVCGAANVAPGVIVPLARVGASIGETMIKHASLRGVESAGMLCSARELGLSDDAPGLLLLPSDAPVGANLAEYLERSDTLLTLKLTPNRGDCLSILGLAREVSAITGAAMIAHAQADVVATLAATRSVALEDGKACPLYLGRLIKLHNPSAATPQWVKLRLERAGLRPISAVVDITNYVMLELGQPLHAFDDDKLHDGITVRFARERETLVLLNQQSVVLSTAMLVIADTSGPVALAGVMGGLDSSVTDQTRNIFLEAAFFAPDAVAGLPRRLGLSSDAAYRFERGVDFGVTRRALERTTQLVIEVCGGDVGNVVEARASLPDRKAVPVRANRVQRVLGIELAQDKIAAAFRRLGFGFTATTEGFAVAPPSHRFDLAIEADFIEEIARIVGYDQIPPIQQTATTALKPQSDGCKTSFDIARALASRDYQEVVTYSFVDPRWEQDFAPQYTPIALRNPIAEQMGVMRTTLLGGLIETLRFNLNRKQDRVRVFEIGRCFLPSAADAMQASAHNEIDGVVQVPRMAGLCYGEVAEEQWAEKKRLADFFDVKSDLESSFQHVKIDFEKISLPILHPGRAASLTLGGAVIGWLGELHPALCQKYELTSAPIVFELDIAPLLVARVKKYAPVSRFPAVRRDIAVVVEESTSAGELLATLKAVAPSVVREIALFDHYHGSNLPAGKKSLAFRVVMNDTEKTLEEEEIEKIDRSLKQTLVSRHQAQLRS